MQANSPNSTWIATCSWGEFSSNSTIKDFEKGLFGSKELSWKWKWYHLDTTMDDSKVAPVMTKNLSCKVAMKSLNKTVSWNVR